MGDDVQKAKPGIWDLLLDWSDKHIFDKASVSLNYAMDKTKFGSGINDREADYITKGKPSPVSGFEERVEDTIAKHFAQGVVQDVKSATKDERRQFDQKWNAMKLEAKLHPGSELAEVMNDSLSRARDSQMLPEVNNLVTNGIDVAGHSGIPNTPTQPISTKSQGKTLK